MGCFEVVLPCLCIAVATLSFVVEASEWTTVTIDPRVGNDNKSCLPPMLTHPCKTMSYAFSYQHDWTEYLLRPSAHVLNESVTFANVKGIRITGANSSVRCKPSSAGLAFVNISEIFLSNLSFSRCAAKRNSTSRDYKYSNKFSLSHMYAGLYFYQCLDVYMTNTSVTDGLKAVGVVMYNTAGTVLVSNSVFSNNSALYEDSGGGGFYAEFSYCTPGDNQCSDRPVTIVPMQYNSNANYTFVRCQFESNRASDGTHHSSNFILPYRYNHSAFGRGGGFSFFFNGNAANNTVSLLDCNLDSNTASWGSGLFAEFHDNSSNNTFLVRSTVVRFNQCFLNKNRAGTGGGGMRIGYYVFNTVPTVGNRIFVEDTQFFYNKALNGGGLSLSPALQSNSKTLGNISITNSVFSNNRARLGAAVHISRFTVITTGHMLSPHFENCRFESNTVAWYYTNKSSVESLPSQVGVGTVYLNGLSVSISKNATFNNNVGSALAVVDGNIDLRTCRGTFQSNSGLYGGAIALLGSAWILVDGTTQLHFYNNTADFNGGALYNVYIQMENFDTYPNCFIHYSDYLVPAENWTAQFVFRNNSAKSYGNSIYSTSILPCAWSASSISDIGEIFCWNTMYWDYGGDNCSSQISSDVGKIDLNESMSMIETYPGERFRLPLVITDDLGHDIGDQTIFSAILNNTKDAFLANGYNYAANQNMSINGEQGTPVSLSLETTGSRKWHFTLPVQLLDCPPGFSLIPDTKTCQCNREHGFDGSVFCLDNKAYLKENYYMSFSPYNSSELVTGVCPVSYCVKSRSDGFPFTPLPSVNSQLDQFVCGKNNRKGVLCGECKDGFGPAINSDELKCVSCSDTHTAANVFKYIATVYLPLFLLFLAIILFSVRLTTGPANAFLVYSQLISSTFYFSADGLSSWSNNFLDINLIPYKVFNLDFFANLLPPFCLHRSLNTLDVIALKYLVAFSPLFMIAGVIVAMKLKDSVCRRVCLSSLVLVCKKKLSFLWHISLLHGFSSFLLLSYNKVMLTSAQLLSTTHLIDTDGHRVATHNRVYFAGQYSSIDSTYVFRYALPAYIIIATFVVIPPVLLLSFPLRWLEKYVIFKCPSRVQQVYPKVKVNILLDTFQGCFKDNRRFFASFYFFYRIVVNFFYVLLSSWLIEFIVQQIVCTMMIALIAILQPYKRTFLNYVDILIFVNLALVNSLGTLEFAYSNINPESSFPNVLYTLQYVLILLPLIYMVAYTAWSVLVWRLWHKIQELRRKRRYKGRLLPASENVDDGHDGREGEGEGEEGDGGGGGGGGGGGRGGGETGVRRYRPTTTIYNKGSFLGSMEGEDEIEAMLRRAEVENTYTPSVSSSRRHFGRQSLSSYSINSVEGVCASTRNSYGTIPTQYSTAGGSSSTNRQTSSITTGSTNNE